MHLQSHWAPCAFTGMHPQTNPQSKFFPQPFFPILGSMFYVIYLTRDSTTQCVCSPGAGFNPPEFFGHLRCTLPHHPNQDDLHNLSPLSQILFYTIYLTRDSTTQCACSPGAGFNPPEFWSICGLPVSCCLSTSVVRSRSTSCPSAFGGARVVFPHPGSSWFWEVWKWYSYPPLPGTLACAAPRLCVVDTRVWLTSSRTYIAFVVPFMVQINSGLGGSVELIKRHQQQQL